MDIIAPSGKFWIAIPSDKASALVAVICAFSARNPIYQSRTQQLQEQTIKFPYFQIV